ncbi:MAG: hypothetical protein AB1451_03455 [Nitrospirota bacterium]
MLAMAWLGAVGLSASACRSEGDSPEAQVRATIGRAEALAEGKDLGGLKALLSDAYRDDAGQDKRAILALLFVQFRRHESIHLLTRIDRIDIDPRAQATATVFTAMAARPIPTVSDLPALRADLYRFDLTLVDKRGTWRVTKSTWRPAVLHDFFPSEATD